MKKIKKVLILGGSSDIGIEVVKIFLKLDWEVVAHFSNNKKVLEKLRINNKKLKITITKIFFILSLFYVFLSFS